MIETQNYPLVFAAIAAVSILFIALYRARHSQKNRGIGPDSSGIVYLAENGHIIDETPLARVAMTADPKPNWGWDGFHDAFAFRFPKLPPRFADCRKLAPVDLVSGLDGDSARLSIRVFGPRLKITLTQANSDRCNARLHLVLQDHKALTNIVESISGSPFPVWIQDEQGTEVWRGPEYSRLRGVYLDQDDETPLFELDLDRLRTEGPLRYMLPDQSELGESWYEVSMSENGGFCSFYATNVTALVRAERAQRGFVQTLTKTFAQLGTGLAIFDRERQLVLFNPALIELTQISAEFLSARPTLSAFFDWLRESRMMPEPRNYSEWRDKVNALSHAAENGTFSELWSLPNGLSYRVLGRPHPDGAVAFLFEDVTAQLSLTRNFVKELEINHALLDTLPDALAIFSPNGDILSVNQAYTDLWGENPNTQVAPIPVSAAIKTWSKKCLASDAWAQIIEGLSNVTSTTGISGNICTLTGHKLTYRITPLTKGAIAIRFSSTTTTPSPKISLKSNAQSACSASLDA
ncbi:MAG: PAS-domain containing protein [Paracoccaceae bacterium]|nr:PAS-domain containing protein [Paracoccaceae bacterium]